MHEFDPSLALKYNKFYIGVAKDGRANNFVSFCPQKGGMLLEVKLKQSDDVQKKVNDAGLEALNYDARSGAYRFRLAKGEPKKHSELLRELIRLAHDNRGG